MCRNTEDGGYPAAGGRSGGGSGSPTWAGRCVILSLTSFRSSVG